jgi:hypothetical protein
MRQKTRAFAKVSREIFNSSPVSRAAPPTTAPRLCRTADNDMSPVSIGHFCERAFVDVTQTIPDRKAALGLGPSRRAPTPDFRQALGLPELAKFA